MCSERPEYNEKIILMAAMAPPVFMGNVDNELLQLNVRHLNLLEVCSIFCFIYFLFANKFSIFFSISRHWLIWLDFIIFQKKQMRYLFEQNTVCFVIWRRFEIHNCVIITSLQLLATSLIMWIE